MALLLIAVICGWVVPFVHAGQVLYNKDASFGIGSSSGALSGQIDLRPSANCLHMKYDTRFGHIYVGLDASGITGGHCLQRNALGTGQNWIIAPCADNVLQTFELLAAADPSKQKLLKARNEYICLDVDYGTANIGNTLKSENCNPTDTHFLSQYWNPGWVEITCSNTADPASQCIESRFCSSVSFASNIYRTTCSGCNSNAFKLVNGECVACPVGEEAVGSTASTCIVMNPCDPNPCSSKQYCQIDSPSLHTCIQCSSIEYTDGITPCETCTPQLNCTNNGDECLTTATTHLLSLTCIECNNGYSKDVNGRCVACSSNQHSDGIIACTTCTSQDGCKVDSSTCLADAVSYEKSIGCTTCDEGYGLNEPFKCSVCSDFEYSNGVDPCMACTSQTGCTVDGSVCHNDATTNVNSLVCNVCKSGFEMDANGWCVVCNNGYDSVEGGNCLDEDECKTKPCGGTSFCVNLPGNFQCNPCTTVFEINNLTLRSIKSALHYDNAIRDCESINYSNQNLTNLEASLFDDFGALNSVDLSKNNINWLPYGVLDPVLDNQGTVVDTTLLLDLKTKCSSFGYYITSNYTLVRKLGPDYTYITSCKVLELHSHNITYVDPIAFENMANVTMLDLSQNNIKELPIDVFTDLTIDLTNGILLDEKAKCTSIAFTLDPSTFTLSFNNESQYNYIYSCKHLSLGNSNIKHFEDKLFKRITPDLTSLDVSRNSIEVSYANFASHFNSNGSKIVNLDISNNNIENIAEDIFIKAFQNLQNLSLSKNNLIGISKDDFKNLVQLGSLDLSFNLISTIEFGAFAMISENEILDLSNNNIDCCVNYPELYNLSKKNHGIDCSLGINTSRTNMNMNADEECFVQNSLQDDHKTNVVGIIIGSVLGGLVLIGIVIGAFIFMFSRRKKKVDLLKGQSAADFVMEGIQEESNDIIEYSNYDEPLNVKETPLQMEHNLEEKHCKVNAENNFQGLVHDYESPTLPKSVNNYFNLPSERRPESATTYYYKGVEEEIEKDNLTIVNKESDVRNDNENILQINHYQNARGNSEQGTESNCQSSISFQGYTHVESYAGDNKINNGDDSNLCIVYDGIQDSMPSQYIEVESLDSNKS